jgi:D-alanyl-lipoteichoic acid acyltransferase DltB (MBOAT superfamily)
MSFKSPLMYALLSAALVLLSAEFLARWRRQILAGLSLVLVTLVLEFSPASLAILAGFLLVHYATLRLTLLTERRRLRQVIFVTWLVIGLASFVVVKQYRWLTDWAVSPPLVPADLNTVGLSFVFFRQVCLAIEVRDGAVLDVPGLEYFNYNLAFWTFLAGPLQRFDAFREQSAQLGAGNVVQGPTVLLALNRCLCGFLKMFVVASAVNPYAHPRTFLGNPDALHLGAFLLAFPVYLYFNFSGYCDIVIGLSRAVGFALPENFNHPYLARNLNDFWARWHITLSQLLRDYLWFPLQTVLARRVPSRVAMVLATTTSFLVMGAWHGNSRAFVIFGLLHGVGVVVANLYSELLKRLLGKDRLKRYRQSRSIRVAATALCQAYVVLTFVPFKYSWPEIAEVLRGLGVFAGGAWL